jgi:hypothetical protein
VLLSPNCGYHTVSLLNEEEYARVYVFDGAATASSDRVVIAKMRLSRRIVAKRGIPILQNVCHHDEPQIDGTF